MSAFLNFVLVLLMSCQISTTEIAEGSFHGTLEDIYGEAFYQFKSYDDAVWWLLTTEEIGFVPNENDEYALVFSNNGTTSCNECDSDEDCECALYDDEFIAIWRK